MKKPIKILVRTLGVFAVLLVAGFLAARHFLLPPSYRTDYDKLIRRGGGYPALRAECAALLPKLTNATELVSGTNLPPLIASLSPQYVTFRDTPPAGVNIVLSGGFYHACVYVVLDERDTAYASMGSIFTRKQLAEGVYLFKE